MDAKPRTPARRTPTRSRAPRPVRPSRGMELALEHALTTLRRLASAEDPTGPLAHRLKILQAQAARAMVPEDWSQVIEGVLSLEVKAGPATLEAEAAEKGATAPYREVLACSARRLLALARALAATGPERALYTVKGQIEDQPVEVFAEPLDDGLQSLVGAAAGLREAKDLLQDGLSEVTHRLADISARNPDRQHRLKQVETRLGEAVDVGELEELRTLLLQEAAALSEDARREHAALDEVRARADKLGTRACRLAEALSTAEREARTDPLTGLGNRRDLEQFASDLAQSEGPRAVLVCDLDKFKGVNDTHGHDAGDSLLAAVAAALSGSLRAGDRVFRTGGDEFVVVVRSASRADAGVVGRRLLQAVAKVSLRVPQATLRASVSIGAAVWSASETFLDAQGRADAALYQVKRGASSDKLALWTASTPPLSDAGA